MLNEQTLGQHAYGGYAMRGKAFDREQSLVLLRLHSRGAHQTFAEIQEAANFKAEVCERLVINGLWRRLSHTSDIISYYDIYVRAVIAKVCSIGRAMVTAVCGRLFAS